MKKQAESSLLRQAIPINSATAQTQQLIDHLVVHRWQGYGAAEAHLRTLGPEAVPALVASAAHPVPQVRAVSVALMDHLADERCLATLQAALHDPSVQVRRHAVHSLGCQRCKTNTLCLDVTALLIDVARHDPSICVRRVAVHQLGLQGANARAMTALEQLLTETQDRGLRDRAAFALRQHQT